MVKRRRKFEKSNYRATPESYPKKNTSQLFKDIYNKCNYVYKQTWGLVLIFNKICI